LSEASNSFFVMMTSRLSACRPFTSINRSNRTGHLFQGRFGSVALDEEHLMNAERNPARASSRARQRACPRPCRSGRLGRSGRLRQWKNLFPPYIDGHKKSAPRKGRTVADSIP
jgi:hypothetical protein